ncbi:MAG: YbhB/YbcL family Raf kinase inhibitor-like protein [Myxococcota bacterium]
MYVRSDSFRPYDWLDPRLALGAYDPASNVRLSSNRNPHLAWSGVPSAAQSLVVLGWDADVPTEGSTVNRPGVTVPLDLPRADFFHWVLCDLPASLREIREGEHASAVTPHGKPLGPSPSGGRQGLNDYTGWFASDPSMSGDWAGYDGPCPPWNDERVHGYRFAVYALDVPALFPQVGPTDRFTGPDVRAAMRGHVLDEAMIVGRYAIWPPAVAGQR